MEGTTNIRSLDVPQLQALVSRYPWFSYAREVLLYKLVEIEPQCLETMYKESLVFFPVREKVLMGCRSLIAARRAGTDVQEADIQVADLLQVEEDAAPGNEVEPLEELSLDLDLDFVADGTDSDRDILLEVEDNGPAGEQVNEVELASAKPKIVVVGGDYFTKEDFAQLEESQRVSEIRLGAPAENAGNPNSIDGEEEIEFDPLDFVTETLAKIYADQGYYDKAIEVYAKLILLYPEKSTYFATLVNEIKSKN